MHGYNARAFYMTGAVSFDTSRLDKDTSKTLDSRGILLAVVRHTMAAPTAHLELQPCSIF
jgi:hypothetical protein